MTIAVLCPHCESRFQLQDDLLGRSIRCPNNDCREIFEVKAISEAPVAPPPPPAPEPQFAPPATVMGNVSDLIPILEGEAANELPYERVEADTMPPMTIVEGEPVNIRKGPPQESVPVAPMILDAEPVTMKPRPQVAQVAPVIPVAPVAEPQSPRNRDRQADGPKQVVWNPAAGLPGASDIPVALPQAKLIDDDDEHDDGDVEDLLLKRRSNRNYWAYVLVGVVVSIFGLSIAAGIVYLQKEYAREQNLADQAFDEFKKQNYPQASEYYKELLEKYPESTENNKYKFFSDLSALHVAAGAVTVQDNPNAALDAFQTFLTDHGNDPLSKPDDTGFGYDVYLAGTKLVDGIIEHSRDRLNRFRGDRKKLVDLAASEASIQSGRAIIPVVEKYKLKEKEIKGLEEQTKKFDELQGECNTERRRLAVIDPYRDLAVDPSEERIADFEAELTRNGFQKDGEALALIATAKTKLRELVRFRPDVRPPVPAPVDRTPGVLFVSVPAGRVIPQLLPPSGDVVPETFFALARGILYAFDSETGNLLWAMRTGSAVKDIPVRLPLGDGINEIVLIPSETAAGPGLTARNARTGQINWYQPLDAPILGRPAIINKRIYLPLKDDAGTIVELEARSGNRLGYIQIRQRIGPGAIAIPNTTQLFVAAEARRIFVIDTAPFDAEGVRFPMRCTHVLATGHRDLSLRVPPAIIGSARDAKGGAARYLLLASTDRTQSTTVTAYLVPNLDKPIEEKVADEIVLTPTASVPTPGQLWYPMVEVGERVALVTDAGAFALLGTNQPGNQDAGLFAIPTTPLPADPRHPMVGQVVTADEDSYWILVRGKLLRMRLSLSPSVGLAVSSSGLPLPGGLPIQSPQANIRRDIVFNVVRSEDSDGIRAMAWDPLSGRVKWDRKLGAVLPNPPIALDPSTNLLVDEDGGTYKLPLAGMDNLGKEGTILAEKSWILAPPVVSARSPARTAVSRDGKSIWVVVPDTGDKESRVLRVRLLESGNFKSEAVVPLPERLAGQALAVGTGVVVPLADGFLYRFDPGASKLIQGPMWRSEQASSDSTCYLSSIDVNEFLGTDGARAIRSWRWSTADSEWKALTGKWELRERIAFTPRMIQLGENTRRLFVADTANSVWMFDGDGPGEILRRWRGTVDGRIPPGKPSLGFHLAKAADGSPRVLFVLDNRHLVCVNPIADDPTWVVRRANQEEFLGGTVDGQRFIVTDLSGTVSVYDIEKGLRMGIPVQSEGEMLPRTQAVPVGKDRLLLPLDDGSVVLLPYPGA